VRSIREVVVRLRLISADEYGRADLFRAQGAHIGRGCRLLIHYLSSEPYLVSIGDETTVSSGVTFVTHDGGHRAFSDLEDRPVNRYGRITIGSHCFIGTGSILLPGVTIGDRAVVGAGSVVTKDVAARTVVVGVPARFVCTLDEYRAKCLAGTLPDLDTSSRKAKRRDLERRI